MDLKKKVLDCLGSLSYTTKKELTIKNPIIAIVHTIGLISISAYVIVYIIIIDKGYQSRVIPTGYVLTKLKGLALNSTSIMNKYNFFDSIDLVPVAMEMDGLFLTTAIVQTWQSRGICQGRHNCVTDANCSTERDNIGIYTGECSDGYCLQYR